MKLQAAIYTEFNHTENIIISQVLLTVIFPPVSHEGSSFRSFKIVWTFWGENTS